MRREWIEMFFMFFLLENNERSPSMRREWIEITALTETENTTPVSLHAEGVD